MQLERHIRTTISSENTSVYCH